MSDMSKKASGVRASSPEATAKRPETWREDKESGGKKSAVGQKDGGLPVQPGGHELASLSESEVGVATKRTKKSVERLDLQAPRHKELTIAHGTLAFCRRQNMAALALMCRVCAPVQEAATSWETFRAPTSRSANLIPKNLSHCTASCLSGQER